MNITWKKNNDHNILFCQWITFTSVNIYMRINLMSSILWLPIFLTSAKSFFHWYSLCPILIYSVLDFWCLFCFTNENQKWSCVLLMFKQEKKTNTFSYTLYICVCCVVLECIYVKSFSNRTICATHHPFQLYPYSKTFGLTTKWKQQKNLLSD